MENQKSQLNEQIAFDMMKDPKIYEKFEKFNPKTQLAFLENIKQINIKLRKKV